MSGQADSSAFGNVAFVAYQPGPAPAATWRIIQAICALNWPTDAQKRSEQRLNDAFEKATQP